MLKRRHLFAPTFGALSALLASIVCPAQASDFKNSWRSPLYSVPPSPSLLPALPRKVDSLANTVSITSTNWKVLKRKKFVVSNPECEDPTGHTLVSKYGERTKRCNIEIADGAGDLLVYRSSTTGPANVHDAGWWTSHYIELDEWPPGAGQKIPVRSGISARVSIWNASYWRIKSIQVDVVPGKDDLKAILEYATPGLYPEDLILFAAQLAGSPRPE